MKTTDDCPYISSGDQLSKVRLVIEAYSPKASEFNPLIWLMVSGLAKEIRAESIVPVVMFPALTVTPPDVDRDEVVTYPVRSGAC